MSEEELLPKEAKARVAAALAMGLGYAGDSFRRPLGDTEAVIAQTVSRHIHKHSDQRGFWAALFVQVEHMLEVSAPPSRESFTWVDDDDITSTDEEAFTLAVERYHERIRRANELRERFSARVELCDRELALEKMLQSTSSASDEGDW